MSRTPHILSAVTLLICLGALVVPSVSHANTASVLPASKAQFLEQQLPVFVNDTRLGTMIGELSYGGYARIKISDMRDLLSTHLSFEEDALLALFGSETVFLERVREKGFLAVYDPSDRVIKIITQSGMTLPNAPSIKNVPDVKAPTAPIYTNVFGPVPVTLPKTLPVTVLNNPTPVIAVKKSTENTKFGLTSVLVAPLIKAPLPQGNKSSKKKRLNQYAQIEDETEAAALAVTEEDFYPLEVPLTVNRAYLGNISAEATLSGIAKVDTSRLLELLADRLSKEKSDILAAYGGDYVLLPTLNEQGFRIVYDASELTLRLVLATEGTSVVSLSGQTIDNIDFESFETPANFSAGTSFILRPRYIHESQSGDVGFAPLSADVRGFISAGGFNNVSFIYELDALEGRDETVRRGDFTLIKDDFQRAIRYQVGDIRPSISGFQNGFNIAGIGIERNYGTIQPFRNLRPGGRSVFTLERTARVDFEVNGTVTSSELLDPGDYDIRDFPLLTGANDVRIIIDDEFGTREVGSYSTFVDTSLLSSGTTLFGVNLGVLREGNSFGFGPEYGNEIIATGFLEKGISDSLTLALQGEVNSDGGYAGNKAVFALGQNIFAVETGLSAFKGFDPGFAGAVQYRLRPSRDRGKISHDISSQVLYQSESFQTIGSRGNPRGYSWQVSVNDSIRMDRFSISLSGTWRRTRSEETTTFSPSINIPLDVVNLSIGYQGVYRKSSNDLDNRFFMSLSKNFGAAGSVRSRTRSGPWESELEWRRLSNREVGAWSGRAGYSVSQIEDELNLDATYIASRAELDISHNSVLGNGFGKTRSSVTDARIGMGLGFADGSLAFGRPVSDGFVIVKAHPGLEGRKIDTKQRSGRLEGITDKLGPALIPLNSPYTEKVHRVSVENLPTGFDIGTDEIKVFPSQNSGYKVSVGSDPTALVLGRLNSAAGEPMSLTVGKLIPIGVDGVDPVDFLTNRTGRFVAERVPPGRYRMVLMPDETQIIELDIGTGQEGVVQVGTITMKETEK